MAKKNTSIMRYDEELAKQAEEYAEQEANTGGGNFFSIRDDKLTFNDTPMPGNQVGAVILDSILVNAYYATKFDKNKPQQPVCYSFGRVEKEMAPHGESPDKQCESCDDCEYNKYGSGEGRGKACKNGRRLALIPAGTYDEDGKKFKPFTDPEQFEKAPVGYLMIPPTSINGFGAFTKQIAGSLKRPPHGIFTKVKLEDKQITFEPIMKAPDDILQVVMARHKEAKGLIEFPFPKPDDRAEPKRKSTDRRENATGRGGKPKPTKRQKY